MGREATGLIEFAGHCGQGKILLEPAELILRGAIRARIPRQQISSFDRDGADLLLTTDQGPLRATLGDSEAAFWLTALAKPPPSLAAKLGLGPHTPARLLGPVTDPALAAALQGCLAPDAGLFIAELPDQTAFDAALQVLADHPNPTFWGITRKGKSAFPDAALRAQMRAAGYIDSKSCAVSETHTATRYGRRS